MYKVIITILIVFLSACANMKNKNESLTHDQTFNTAKVTNSASYHVKGKSYHVLKKASHYEEKGVASWYGRKFHKKRTSSGERYNMYRLTAAHKTLPLSTYVLVTNLKNGRHVIVKVNDRGPFVYNRLIDLSYAAAKKLGMVGSGTAPVTVKVVTRAYLLLRNAFVVAEEDKRSFVIASPRGVSGEASVGFAELIKTWIVSPESCAARFATTKA